MCLTNYQLWQLEKYGDYLQDEEITEDEERVTISAAIDFANEERLRND